MSRYRIKLKARACRQVIGDLGPWQFDERSHATVISGDFDQPQLYALLRRLHDRRLELLELRRLDLEAEWQRSLQAELSANDPGYAAARIGKDRGMEQPRHRLRERTAEAIETAEELVRDAEFLVARLRAQRTRRPPVFPAGHSGTTTTEAQHANVRFRDLLLRDSQGTENL